MPAQDELLAIDGPDAVAFAHAQFSSDVRSLMPGCWHWSAWLNAQGRVQHFFALLRTEATQLVLWLPSGGAEPMARELRRFLIRVKLELRVLDDWAVSSPPDASIDESVNWHALRRHASGYGLLLPGTSPRMTVLAPIRDEGQAPRRTSLDDVVAGLPFLAPSLAGEFLPQALDLERLDAIRFDKGCYPGQEIAARLHFRGGNKSLLYRLGLPHCENAPEPGTRVLLVDQPVGHVLYGVHDAAAGGVQLLATLSASRGDPAELVVAPDHAVAEVSREFFALSAA